MSKDELQKSGFDVMDNKAYSRLTDALHKSQIRHTLKDDSGLIISQIDEQVT